MKKNTQWLGMYLSSKLVSSLSYEAGFSIWYLSNKGSELKMLVHVALPVIILSVSAHLTLLRPHDTLPCDLILPNKTISINNRCT